MDNEQREEATYIDKLMVVQATIEAMINSRFTRQKGQSRGAAKTPKGK